MKSIIFLTILALAVACCSACDPDSDNQPSCTSANVGVPIRNFFDPTHYWLCNAAGATAESVQCPPSEGFDSSTGACIHFSKWNWTTCCPDDAAAN